MTLLEVEMLWMLVAVGLAVTPVDSPVWEQVSYTQGQGAWEGVETVAFRWHHLPSDTRRSYVWHVLRGQVEVTLQPDAEAISVPVVPGDPLEGSALEAHQAFINDMYWLLFEQRAATDTAKRAQVPPDDSPFPDTASAYEVVYPSDVGHTPGDRYVVWVGPNYGRPIGWSYFPSGQSDPKVSTTRERWVEAGGMTVPTRFVMPDGTPFIEIDQVAIDRR
jgi:hypothetical protein